jgi:hypothetical protein
MAVRKDIIRGKYARQYSKEENEQQEKEQRRASPLESISQEYDISLIASTEHLRAGSNPLSIPQLPSPTIQRPAAISAYRHRFDSRGLPSISDQGTFKPPGSGGYSLQRSATTNSAHQFARSRTAAGLWGSISAAREESLVESSENESDDIVPNFGEPASASSSIKPEIGEARPQNAIQESEQPTSQRGLWSSAIIAQEREPVQKRRWTVTEHQ